MKKMLKVAVKLLIISFLLLNTSLPTKAQELNCNVIINADRVQTQERQIIEQLRSDISKFMNTGRWTKDVFAENERIKCTIFLNLDNNTKVGDGLYSGTAQIQSVRPVHGTDYESPVLNFFDKSFSFTYRPSQPLIFTENVFTSNLTATLAFYAYTIVALDYDSFAKNGGNPYYEQMLSITNNARQAGGNGWGTSDTRNRSWLSDNLNNPQMLPFREAIYEYHRLVLDDFMNNSEEKRKLAVAVLKKISKVREVLPTAVTLNAFFDAKSAEMINLFSEGEDEKLRAEAVALLVRMDPTNGGKYKKLLRP